MTAIRSLNFQYAWFQHVTRNTTKMGFSNDRFGFNALSFGSVAFRIPKRFLDVLLATELRHRTVDCHSSHDGDNTVFLLAAVHVEQHFECTSCHTRFFVCKVTTQRVRPCKPIEAIRRNFQCHVLKITFQRVMIWRPFFFNIPLSFALPHFFLWHRLAS